MNSNKEYNVFINQNYKKNINNNNINNDNNNIKKNSVFTDSDNEEYFLKNYDTEKNINTKEKYNSKTTKPEKKDINNIDKLNNNNYYHMNYNNHDNTIPISKKAQNTEIQNIDMLLKCLKDDGNNNSLKKNKNKNNCDDCSYKNDIMNNNINMPTIEELKNQKDILIIKLKKIKQKNKELMTYLEPYKQSMTNEDIENEQRIKYMKYLDDKRKEYIKINNKLKHKLMNNQHINIKKKIEYLINKQIKEYDKLLSEDLSTNENLNDFKSKNVYTNNNMEIKCELSLSGVNSNSDYKMNNATTDGLINSKHKNIINDNLNNKNINIKSNKLNKNNSIIFGGEDKNKNNNNNNNNNSLKIKKNNSKSNFLSSIKYIKNSKITRNNNTSSSITSSHDNYNVNNNNNNINKKNDYKLLKQNSKITNGLNFK